MLATLRFTQSTRQVVADRILKRLRPAYESPRRRQHPILQRRAGTDHAAAPEARSTEAVRRADRQLPHRFEARAEVGNTGLP